MKLLTFETAKGRLPQFETGDLLLIQIQAYIKKHGRARLLYQITNREAPEWFDAKTKAEARKRHRKNLLKRHHTAIHGTLDIILWSEEQIKVLRDNWTKLHSSEIGYMLGKNRKAVENKARSILTEEEFKQRKYLRDKKK